MRNVVKSASGGRQLVILILTLFVVLGMPLIASAAKTSQASETVYLLGAEENLEGNLWQAASDLTIDGKVEGTFLSPATK